MHPGSAGNLFGIVANKLATDNDRFRDVFDALDMERYGRVRFANLRRLVLRLVPLEQRHIVEQELPHFQAMVDWTGKGSVTFKELESTVREAAHIHKQVDQACIRWHEQQLRRLDEDDDDADPSRAGSSRASSHRAPHSPPHAPPSPPPRSPYSQQPTPGHARFSTPLSSEYHTPKPYNAYLASSSKPHSSQQSPASASQRRSPKQRSPPTPPTSSSFAWEAVLAGLAEHLKLHFYTASQCFEHAAPEWATDPVTLAQPELAAVLQAMLPSLKPPELRYVLAHLHRSAQHTFGRYSFDALLRALHSPPLPRDNPPSPPAPSSARSKASTRTPLGGYHTPTFSASPGAIANRPPKEFAKAKEVIKAISFAVISGPDFGRLPPPPRSLVDVQDAEDALKPDPQATTNAGPAGDESPKTPQHHTPESPPTPKQSIEEGGEGGRREVASHKSPSGLEGAGEGGATGGAEAGPGTEDPRAKMKVLQLPPGTMSRTLHAYAARYKFNWGRIFPLLELREARKIHVDHLVRLMATLVESSRAGPLRQFRSVLDLHGDGEVDLRELTQALHHFGGTQTSPPPPAHAWGQPGAGPGDATSPYKQLCFGRLDPSWGMRHRPTHYVEEEQPALPPGMSGPVTPYTEEWIDGELPDLTPEQVYELANPSSDTPEQARQFPAYTTPSANYPPSDVTAHGSGDGDAGRFQDPYYRDRSTHTPTSHSQFRAPRNIHGKPPPYPKYPGVTDSLPEYKALPGSFLHVHKDEERFDKDPFEQLHISPHGPGWGHQ